MPPPPLGLRPLLASFEIGIRTRNPNNGATGNSRLAAIIRTRRRQAERAAAAAALHAYLLGRGGVALAFLTRIRRGYTSEVKTRSKGHPWPGKQPRHLVVVVTRLAPSSGLDPHDGLGAALKGVVDGLADALGLSSDRDPRVRWVFAQERSPPGRYGVRVELGEGGA